LNVFSQADGARLQSVESDYFLKTKPLWNALLRMIGVGGIIPLHSGAGETIAVLSVEFRIKRCGESCFFGVV